MISTKSIQAALSDAGLNGVFAPALINAGVPVNGTTGKNIAGPGCLLLDITNKVLYINAGTSASPTWIAVQSAQQTTQTLAAAGTTQANGAAITLPGSGIVYATGANTTVGVVLPVATVGAEISIVNDAAANAVLKVYGNVSDSATINGTAGSTAYSIVAKATVDFFCVAAGKWQTSPLTSS